MNPTDTAAEETVDTVTIPRADYEKMREAAVMLVRAAATTQHPDPCHVLVLAERLAVAMDLPDRPIRIVERYVERAYA